MKRVILHIGVHKTGSTSLQNFLLLNRKKFLNHSVLYPESGLVGPAHHRLAYIFLPQTEPRLKFYGEQNPKEELFENVLRQFEESGCNTLLLSSEAFHEYIDMPRLKSNLNGYDVKIVVYLRRQDNWLLSAYAQRVKQFESRFSGAFNTFPPYRSNRVIVDYRRRLQGWADFFGSENVAVRVYEKALLSDGLSCDFCKAIGIPYDRSYKEAKKDPNKSLSRDGVEIVRFFNNIKLDRTVHNYIVNYVMENFPPKTGQNAMGLISPAERLEIINFYKDSNAYVAKHYLGREDGILFQEPLPDTKKSWKPQIGLEESSEKLKVLLRDLLEKHAFG